MSNAILLSCYIIIQNSNFIISKLLMLNKTQPQNLHETFTLNFSISNHRFKGRDSIYGNQNQSSYPV